MPIDAIGRKQRAIKAANRLAKIRKAKTEGRDICLVLAFKYLSDNCYMSIDERVLAVSFLIEQCGKPKLDKGESVLRKLADCTGLTRQRVHQIINKAQKNTI